MERYEYETIDRASTHARYGIHCLIAVVILTGALSCSRTTESVTSKPADSARIEKNQSANPEVHTSFPDYVRRTAIPDTFLLDSANVIYGDFNADQRQDYASKVTNLKNGFQGVMIIHDTDPPTYRVFGAGQEVHGMKNLDWINVFKVLPKGEIIAPTLVDSISGDIIGEDSAKRFKLIGNGIYMHVDEAGGGGILFWTGRTYEWYHLE
jgi:hypothetical protein